MLQNPWSIVAKARQGLSMPAYAYAANNPINYVDPDGLDTVINIWRGESAHASVYVDHGTNGTPELYDPGGAFGSGWIHEGEGVLDDYVEFWKERKDPVQEQYRFKTTPAEELQIATNFGSKDPGKFFCASSSSTAISGVGPFHSIRASFTPGGLGDDLKALRRPKPPPVRHRLPGRWQ